MLRIPLAAIFVSVATLLAAQMPSTRVIVVSETAGIRRTEYPTDVRVEFARGVLQDATSVRLRADDAEVPAQFTARSSWDDGSVRVLSVAFNLSIGPAESRTLSLDYGPGAMPAPFTGRGLTVTQTPDAIQVGNVRFGRSGSPLILSANYVKSEFIGTGPNGIAVTDDARMRHELSSARQLQVELLQRGPLLVVLRYRGRIPFDAGYAVPTVVTIEMPNSKSWIKVTARVEDPARRVRALAIETPLAFGAHPWTWDFGTENATYGAFRNPTDTAVLTQVVDEKGPRRWEVQTGPRDQRRTYEVSVLGGPALARGWGHLLDARGAVAFAVEDFGRRPGRYTIDLSGTGAASFTMIPASPATEHQLAVYEHFVSAPVPIGAATSPAAMISPLRVEVQRR